MTPEDLAHTAPVGAAGQDSGSFRGQTALITGGASGIGLATAHILAREGARIVIADLDESRGRAAVGGLAPYAADATSVPIDITDPAAVTDLVDGMGTIDVLVNNAGTTAPAAPAWETPVEVFESMMRVHYFGTVHLCQAVVPGMIAQGYGRIVNVASVAGKEGNAGSAAYSSAKAAVLGFTKSLGKELATTGVLVNAVTPGVIRTPLLAKASPAHIARLQAKIPMDRPGEPEEIAELIAWLASRKCSFSTGAVFDASGGRATY